LDAHRVRTSLVRAAAFCLGVALTALSAISAQAADLPSQSLSPPLTKAPIADDWTGFYVGAHLGYVTAHSDSSATQPDGAPNLSGSLDYFRAFDLFKGTGSISAVFKPDTVAVSSPKCNSGA